MATINVCLPDAMKTWVKARLKDGSFCDTSDYVRHLIRNDKDRTQAVDALQKAIEDGVKSGAPKAFDVKAFKARMNECHSRKSP